MPRAKYYNTDTNQWEGLPTDTGMPVGTESGEYAKFNGTLWVAGKIDGADIDTGTVSVDRLPVATSGTSSSTQIVRADDSRLNNARTPLGHTHDAADTTGGTFDIARLPVAASGVSNTTSVVRADDSRLANARTPLAHQHSAVDVTTGTLDIARLPVAASGVSNTTSVVRADDARLSNARTPTAHVHDAADVTSGRLDFTRGWNGAMKGLSSVFSTGTVVAGTVYNIAISFPPGLFASSPVLLATPVGVAPGVGFATVGTPTTTSGQVNAMRNASTSSFNVYWLAVTDNP